MEKNKGKEVIFISGVAGFLGSHIADHFIANGHKVIGCDNLLGGYLDNVNPKVKFHKCDLTDFKSVVKITKSADIVFHCAATAYEGLSVFSPYLVTKNIVDASVSLITASVINKVQRFINYSSMARYGKQKPPFTEDMTPKPEDPYGIGKYAVELFLKNIAETHGMEWVNIIPHNIIGPRQKYDDPYRNVASIMINLMLQGRQPIIYGDGQQKRCFSFVNDVNSLLDKLAFSKQVAGESINIGPDDEFVTINELAKTIAKLLDFSLKPVHYDPRPKEVKLANCSANKARKLLCYKTEYTLEEGLQQIIDYIKEKGVRPFKYHLDLEIKTEKTPKTWTKKLF